MDLSLYELSLGADSIPNGLINSSIMHVNEIFDKSPSFKKVSINNVEVDVLLNHTKKSNELGVLFRPQYLLDSGSYLEFNTHTYILTEFIANEIYPKGKLELCNSTLKWNDESGKLNEYKCIIKGNSYDEDDITGSNKTVIDSESEIKISVQYNEDTKKIKAKQRFIFDGNAYEVNTIDTISRTYLGVGIIDIGVKYTSLTSTDDTDNDVANEDGNSGWGEW